MLTGSRTLESPPDRYGEGLKLEDADWATLDGLNDLIETQKLGAPLRASYK